LRDNELTKLLGWPGYRVYRHEINERAKTLKLWIRRKRGNRKLVCSGCGRKLDEAHEVSEREVRDLPCMEFCTTVVVEVYRVCCPDCGIKMEKVPQLPSKAPQTDGSSPVVIFIYVPDVDQTIGVAIEYGAKILVAAQNQFWGDRSAVIMDPNGHVWTVASRIEETTAQERTDRWSKILHDQREG